MASSVYIPLKTVFNDAGIKQAQRSIGGLGKSLKGALGALGVGIGISAVVSQLQQASKAAAQDVKSQALLAQQLRNTTNATDGQIVSVEKFITKLQAQTSIVDDQLRPAMSQLVMATGDVTSAQKLLAIATDVSAATGKDLSTVSLALGKAVNGQTTALFRMLPNLKNSSNWMSELQRQTSGAAEAAANTDPFQRLNVIFGELQEQIGVALLPYLQQVADYFASDTGQAKLREFATNVGDIATAVVDLANALKLSGVLDDLATLVQRLAAFSKGDFATIGQQDANAAMKQWIDLYNTDRRAYEQKLDLLKKVKGDFAKEQVKRIEDYVKSNRPTTGGGSSTIDQFLNAGGLIGSGKTPFTLPDQLKKDSGATKKLAADNKALADAVAKAKEAFDAKVKAYEEAVQAAQQIIDSTKEMTASFTALFKVTPKMGEFESKTVDAFQNIFDTINDALDKKRILPKAAASLTAYATSTINAMKAIAKQQDVLAGKIDVARTITAGVTGLAQITGMLETTTESVVTSTRTIAGGIETIITKTADVTKSGGLVDNFQKLVDKTKAFAKNLIDLKKMGLNKNLFAQLVNAGADAGGATAQAIVDGGSETITALNDLYGQLDSAAAEIAQTSTDTLYEVGQQVVSNGFIEGLVSQSDALAAAAEAMANSFASAFNSQLAAALQANLPAMPVAEPKSLDLLASRPDPKRSPQSYATWLAGIGGIDPIRSPQSYAAQQKTYNVTLNTGIVTSPAGLGAEIVSAISAYERASGSVYMSAS